jgi:hypothetical protein
MVTNHRYSDGVGQHAFPHEASEVLGCGESAESSDPTGPLPGRARRGGFWLSGQALGTDHRRESLETFGNPHWMLASRGYW